MVKVEVIDLSVSKKAMAKMPKAVEASKPEPVKKVVMRVVKPAEPKVEEVKVLPVPQIKAVEVMPVVAEEVKPKAKGSRFEKGSDQAKAWAAKMREAKLAKKAQAGKEVLLEASD
jgi:hypothetical protein